MLHEFQRAYHLVCTEPCRIYSVKYQIQNLHKITLFQKILSVRQNLSAQLSAKSDQSQMDPHHFKVWTRKLRSLAAPALTDRVPQKFRTTCCPLLYKQQRKGKKKEPCPPINLLAFSQRS